MTGPERPTYWERFINLLPVPYTAGSLIIAAIIAGPGRYLVGYLETFDIYKALQDPFTPPTQSFPLWRTVLNDTVSFLLLFFIFYMIRYMRLKLVAAEPELLPVSPEGEETFHRVFGRVSRPWPPIILASMLFFFNAVLPYQILGSGQSQPIELVAPFAFLFSFVTFPLVFAVFATFIWVYFSSIWGLHKLGKAHLKLKSFNEDPMLGVRPIGSISLSLALAYFTGLGGLGLLISLGPTIELPSIVLLSLLIPLGAAMFFLPLNSIHQRMLEGKQREQSSIRSRFSQLVNASNTSESEVSQSSVAYLKNLFMFEVLKTDERRVTAMPTWPFDTRVLGRLAAIVLTVVAIIIARVIQLFVLHI